MNNSSDGKSRVINLNAVSIILILSLACPIPSAQTAGAPPARSQGDISVDGDISSIDQPAFTCTPVAIFKNGDKVPALISDNAAWSVTTKPLQIGTNSVSFPILATIKNGPFETEVLVPAIFKIKTQINPGAPLHTNDLQITTTRTLKAGEVLPVVAVGDSVLSLETSSNPQNTADLRPLFTIFPDNCPPAEQASHIAAWAMELKHVKR
jgi:predicted secreted protein